MNIILLRQVSTSLNESRNRRIDQLFTVNTPIFEVCSRALGERELYNRYYTVQTIDYYNVFLPFRYL